MTDQLDAPADLDGTTYADAMAELEQILRELEDDAVDVDRLSGQVRRAAELIRLCRSRIDRARVDVTEIVAELTADAAGDEASETG